MDDLISRQAILESIERISVKGNVLDDDWIYRFIQEFPSAQPQSTMCQQTGTSQSTKDLISRHAAIDAIEALVDAMFKNIEKGATFPKRQWFDGMANAQSIIEDLPSAQPDWDEMIVICDCCGHAIHVKRL